MKTLRDSGPGVARVVVEVQLEGGDMVRYELEQSETQHLTVELALDYETRVAPNLGALSPIVEVERTGGLDLRLDVKVRPR